MITVLIFTVFFLGAMKEQVRTVEPDIDVLGKPSNDEGCVTIVSDSSEAKVVLDVKDYPVVQLAANLFAEDVQRVTGRRLTVTNTAAGSSQLIVVGSLGRSAIIQKLVTDGKLKDLDKVRGRWEGTLEQVVSKPFPGVERALVIVGSDRRGAAYGLMRLSQKIGVSPWYWWADVPASHQDALAIQVSKPQMDAPDVKYRGFFINDEDWGHLGMGLLCSPSNRPLYGRRMIPTHRPLNMIS